MPTDAEFHATSLEGKSVGVRAKALIAREVRKRVIWSLAYTDWFSIPFRRSWVLGKAQITTPLPLNIHDECAILFDQNRREADVSTAGILVEER